LYSRYDELEKQRSTILRNTPQNADSYYQLCLEIHSFLYQDILSNAGQFRRISDPSNGNVYPSSITLEQFNEFLGGRHKRLKSKLES
jgi:fido (protein-threonine AMPylation protein)